MSYLTKVIQELKTLFPNYEERVEQQDMWETVYQSMKTKEKAAIHAPTGTGKSLGFIIPYIAMKLEDPAFKITISTYTLNLQEQLKKDMELGITIYNRLIKKSHLKRKALRYVALKGANNYFCHKRFDENRDAFTEEKIARIEKRLTSIPIHDKQHLNLRVSGKEWGNLSVQQCAKQACPFHETCTYYQAFRAIDQNDVVILNHSLFFRRYYFVEPWEAFHFHVFDEAHKLEKVMLETHTYTLSLAKIREWVDLGDETAKKFKSTSALLHHLSDERIYRFHDFFEALEKRREKRDTTTATFQELGISENVIKNAVKTLASWQKDMVDDFIEQVETKERTENATYKEEKGNWVTKLMELKAFSTHMSDVVWVEKTKEDELLIHTTPKSLDRIDTPFKKGTLFTSGTLAIDGTCNSFAKRLHVTLDHNKTLPSPFPLHEQSLIYVARHINPKQQFDEKVMRDAIFDLVKAGDQKTFVLFTNNTLMWSTFKLMAPALRQLSNDASQPVELWIQDKTNHKEVMRSFEDPNVRSILFGTLSYFEGVDLKGESLTQIILTRLPYSRPDHPIQKILDKQFDYSKWEAVVRYEQAYGRLIRTIKDYGSFCILDNRVSYLKHFVNMFSNEGIPFTNRVEDVAAFHQKKK